MSEDEVLESSQAQDGGLNFQDINFHLKFQFLCFYHWQQTLSVIFLQMTG